MTDKESKLYNFMTTPDTQSTANSTITNMSTHRSMNQLQVLRYLNTYDQNVNVNKLSTGEQSKRAVKRINYSTNSNENKGEIRIDGGCNTILFGDGFIVELQTNRSVDAPGFTNSIKVERLLNVSAITALDL